MLLEPHFASPVDVYPAINHLLTQPLRRRQGETFIRKEEIADAVPLLEPIQLLNRPSRILLPEILVIEGERTERAILVIAPARELDREHRLRGQVPSEGKSVIVGSGKLIQIFGVEGLVDDDLTVLTIDQVRHLAKILFSPHLIDQLEQGSLTFEYNDIVRDIKQTGTTAQVVDEARK